MTETNPPPIPPDEYNVLPTEPNPEARLWGMFCHLFALGGYIFPLGNLIGPLIAWLAKKNDFPFVDDQGKESLNFQITMLIAAACATVLMCAGIGSFLLIAVGIFDIVFIIVASVHANDGKTYRYPFCLRLIKMRET